MRGKLRKAPLRIRSRKFSQRSDERQAMIGSFSLGVGGVECLFKLFSHPNHDPDLLGSPAARIVARVDAQYTLAHHFLAILYSPRSGH